MDPASVEVTVVLPAHNEEGNVLPLMDQFGELARKARFTIEVVLVDDGSTDQTLPRAVEAQQKHRFLRIIALPYRRGLTEALRAGFSVARGQIVVFYPADRQFHPADIPRMVEKVRSGYDLVTGRKIGFYNKKFVSSFYNRLSRWLFPSIKVSDLNSVKAFRRELVDVFDYRHDWHRFWVAIVAEAGYRIGEVDVTLYQRGAGRSKFGIWRIPGGVLDLVAVKFQYHTMKRPLWYFGMTGIALLAASFLLGGVAIYQRFVEGHGYRPLVYLVMSLGMAGVVFFAIGFLAEAVAGVRQQLEQLKPSPKHHVHKPGSPDAGQPRRPEPERPAPRPERPERTEHRDSGNERLRDQNRSRRNQTPRRDEPRRNELPLNATPVAGSPPIAISAAVPELEVSLSPVEARHEISHVEQPVDRPSNHLDSPSAASERDAEPVDTESDRPVTSSSEPNDVPTPQTQPGMYGRRKRG